MDEKHQRKFRRMAVIVITAALGTIAGILFAAKMQWTNESHADNLQEYLTAEGESPFVAVAENVKPAVVSISTEIEESLSDIHEFFDMGPFREFFQQPDRGGQPKTRKTQAGGTGIIISQDGYILTNNHLVEKSKSITVRLADDEEFEAKVIGADPMTDVALIRLENAKLKPEQVARLGNSENIKIGEWAIAIGSPFGLDWTVTVGVISAKGRGGLNIGGGGPDVQNFIQTDASINFGNSGGPLVNIKGEVIGINTAINAQGQGIGFAIPINIAREVSEQLKKDGKVSHGYLGMSPAELTSAKKEALGLDNDVRGVFVDQVEEDTPAAKGGLEAGDVIIEVDGTKITAVPQFRTMIATKKAGDKVKAKIVRDNKQKTLEFVLGDRSEYILSDSSGRGVQQGSENWLGIQVEGVNSQKARQWNIRETEGALVVDIDNDSPAENVLQPGDVIIEIDKRPVKDVKDFRNIAKDLKDRDKSILFRIVRNSRKTFEVVKP